LEEQTSERSRRLFPVVGVGASAGGLEAFTQMLRALPVDTGMAFVLIQHLAPTRPSLLAEILSRATRMPVIEVHDEPPVEPNHVYVIPPDRDMIISDGVLKLLPRTEVRGQHRPIDQFFRSLAKDQGEQAIGVILSGTATDGTLGLGEIKAEGGIAFAQDKTAQQDSMPRSAYAAGCVDFMLPPDEISREIARIARHPHVALRQPEETPVAEPAISKILRLLHLATGADFTHYKENTVYRRITRRMALHKVEGLNEYLKFLQENPKELETLYQDLLISVTSFFRNPELFESLKQKIFPRLVKERSRNDPLRIWVLGCSTGEEAYSMAIAYAEFAEASASLVPLQLFATDLNVAGIEKARAGLYPKSIGNDVSPDRLRRFFVEVDGHYRVSRTIRERCVFAQHNVLSNPPFSRMDLISCRNLLIYLQSKQQSKVLPLLHYALNSRGVLVLGSAETIGSYRDLFEAEDPKERIFSRKPGPTQVIGFPVAGSRSTSDEFEKGQREARVALVSDMHKEAERILLAKYAPAGVLINAEMEILQFRGDTGPYLTPAPGKASLNLLKMAREGLMTALASTIQKAKNGETSVRAEGLRVKSNGGYRDINLEVIPVKGDRECGLLVLFEDVSRSSHSDQRKSTTEPGSQDSVEDRSAASSEQLESLEKQNARLIQEAAATREYLQSVIEQQEAANEELQSANEEVQSANEELQSINEELETSKEEIQSSNEELAIVNDELQNRNTELNLLTNDLSNLLSSVQMAIVMLAPDLRIRRFTPTAEKILNLGPSDIGRPISDIKLPVSIVDLELSLLEVIDTVAVKESEIQDQEGRWYSLRVRPYKTLENKINGAVLVLVDIDKLKRAREYAESIVATVREPLLVLDTNLRVQTASRSFYKTFKVTPKETEHRLLYALGNGQWNIPALCQMLEDILPKCNSFDDFLVQHQFEHIGRRTMLLNARRLVQEPDQSGLILLAIQDVTERKALIHQVEKLAAADRVRNEFLAMLAHELRNPLAPLLNVAHVLRNTESDPATIQRTVDIIDRQTRNMARLVDDLLNASRINLQKVQLKKEPVELALIISRAHEEIKPRLELSRQALTVSLPPEPVYLEADPTRLEQVFANLLDNASKFSEEGGHIALKAELASSQPGGETCEEVIIWVRDDGIGIAPEMLTDVFDVFVQGEGSLQRKRGGLGVGLTIVRGLVELHGGRVEAHSAGLGQGSEFVVRLPILRIGKIVKVPIDNATNASVADSDSGTTLGRRILLVDDNPDVVDTLALTLRLAGYEVQTTDNGPDAVKAAMAMQPDVVLLDIGLPGMDGYEVARQLRQQPSSAMAQLIAVTGYGSEEDRRQAREAGFDHHLTKPVDPDELKKLLTKRD
jgi:two-component system CheB/CheR fusion protein